ncbi:MAG TPA: helix-turn-helix domain-containing protein [Solirubrobacteraceae bacterium]|jgi:hypothetical protein|nr:helix-turn-helix domain-containing protein [Solirubrobacteraceae bacterium]
MAPDLLSTICDEIDERLNELRPLLAEYEQLLGAVSAIEPARRGSAKAHADGKPDAEPAKRPEAAKRPGTATAQRPTRSPRSTAPPKPERAARGAAREAILGALEHGSHTVGELAVVTAMSGPNINGNLRRLALEGVVAKTVREGKTAWSLA